MKSSEEVLASRGFLNINSGMPVLSLENKFLMLKSNRAVERTLAARVLAGESGMQVITNLIEALKVEQKLYTKIEICNTLISFGISPVQALIEQLGRIGKNQYKLVPQNKFNKKSYPLPRDIAARTLGNIGIISLPGLLDILSTDNMSQLSEGIDAIGYICFYNKYQEHIYEKLIQCFLKNKDNELIRWKTIRSLCAFPESKSFLEYRLEAETNFGIRLEIQRSTLLLNSN